MTKWQKRSRKKTTGGILRPHGQKRRHQRGRDYHPAELGENKVVKVKGRGGQKKKRLLSVNTANIQTGKKVKKAKILDVLENPANIHFVRRNIVTKGAVVDTDLGKAKVTSRPGQSGVVNAKLIKEKKE